MILDEAPSAAEAMIVDEASSATDTMIVDEAPSVLVVQTSAQDEIRHLWATASKSKWLQLRKEKLIETLSIMKPEEKLASATKAQLITMIQKWVSIEHLDVVITPLTP
jgi:hypothetical protein